MIAYFYRFLPLYIALKDTHEALRRDVLGRRTIPTDRGDRVSIRTFYSFVCPKLGREPSNLVSIKSRTFKDKLLPS